VIQRREFADARPTGRGAGGRWQAPADARTTGQGGAEAASRGSEAGEIGWEGDGSRRLTTATGGDGAGPRRRSSALLQCVGGDHEEGSGG
jgi:hypothetical protein